MDAAVATFESHKLIRHENLLWMIVAQGVVILPLLFHLPPWLWLVWLGSMLWRLRIYAGKMAFPSSSLKFVLGALCVGGLVASYRGQIGVEPMIGFLVCAFVLKLLELRTHKDGLLLLFIGFIGVAAQFLFAQTFSAALYAWCACITLVTAWQTIYLTRHFSILHKIKTGFSILLHALPLMVVMFVIMPRLGPLWHVPLPQGAGKTGFSDTLSPGDLGQLVKSQGTAFRVSFNSESAPLPSQMYWRGLVLDEFDGRSWRLSDDWDVALNNGQRFAPKTQPVDGFTDYTIQLEPHQYPWLFALVEPVKVSDLSIDSSVFITQQGLLAARSPIVTRAQYSVISAHEVVWPPLSATEQAKLLRLPPNSNPKAQRLAQSWQQQGLAPKAIVAQALELFNQSFYYTLAPPVLGQNSVDEFLFTTKRGFCEHFASSFAVLMRAAGIPSRVVVGYQGGTYNALEDYWRVSQADAHAWVELWLEESWQRIDPTSAVAPERIALGIGEALSEQERALVGAGHFDAPKWLTAMRLHVDAAGFVWNRWVLNYDSGIQGELFNSLFGGREPWRIGIALTVLIAGLFTIYALLVIRPKWQQATPLQKALKQFDKTCLKLGFERSPDESLSTFTKRLENEAMQYSVPCQALALIAQQSLYADNKKATKALVRALRQFPRL